MRSIARECEVRGRVGAGQVKVDDVVSLCDLKRPPAPLVCVKVSVVAWPMNLIFVRSKSSDPPKSLMVPLNESCSSTSQPLLMMVSVACG